MQYTPVFFDDEKFNIRYQDINTLHMSILLAYLLSLLVALVSSNDVAYTKPLLFVLGFISISASIASIGLYVMRLDVEAITRTSDYFDVRVISLILAIEVFILFIALPEFVHIWIPAFLGLSLVTSLGFWFLWQRQKQTLVNDLLYMAFIRTGKSVSVLSNVSNDPIFQKLSDTYSINSKLQLVEDIAVKRSRIIAQGTLLIPVFIVIGAIVVSLA